MVGLGTILNVGGILAGGILGLLIGGRLPARLQETMTKTCGLAVLFMAAGGALSKMMYMEDGALESGSTMLIIGCLTLGALCGELIDLDGWLNRFGEWLKRKTGSARDKDFVEGFVSASLTVCVGAMAIVGALQDGLYGDYTTLAAKTVLDTVIVMVMSCTKGKGCIFSALPVAVLQGGVTLLAGLLRPLMTAAALANLSMIGSILVFCVGVNLLWGPRIRVANLLPAIVFAVAAAFLP